MPESLEARLKFFQGEVDGQAHLLPVSKYVDSPIIRSCYQLGIRNFAEARVQDLMNKSDELKDCEGLNWHFVGNLQRNKVKKLLSVKGLYAIHSVDRLELLHELLKNQEMLDRPVKVFLQVNTSGESEKSGFLNLDEVKKALELLQTQSGKKLEFQGLMTMATLRTAEKEQAAEHCFKALSQFRDILGAGKIELSMGMSSDYQQALKYGADWIRIGRAIFL
ncbi:MAG: YggS family pyridoxal phosphate-dependent enzyme [Bacteriovoracaceae bacterium]